jgi:ankyrin repeat protein
MQNEDQATLANINKLYSQILQRIEETDQQMHKAITRAFSWISCTREPLELEALLQAISAGSNFDINQSEFLGSCANLLCVDPILNVVQFAHASVKDYLETLSDFDLRLTHGIAAASCLDLCNICEVSDISSGVHPGQSISVYAAMYWAYHYNSAGATIQQDLALDHKLIEFFFVEDEDSLCFEMWVDLVEDISQMLPRHHDLTKQLNAIKSEPPTPLFAACIFGFESVLEVLLSRPSFDIDQRNIKDHTGLYLASTFGHDKLISRLLTNGADAEVVCGKFGNAFYAACANGNNGALEYLQKHLMPTQPESFFETALELSLRGGHSHTAEFLLKGCVSIDTQKEYDKLFDIASDLGTVAILQYLRTRYPKYAASKPVSSKALDSAFRKGLLSQIKAYAKRTPLPIDSIAIASYYGQNETVLFCLDRGLDIEEVGSFGSPLRAASLMGHASTVRKLLDHGAAVNNGGTFGDPLQAAAMHGHVAVAEILLQHGAGVNNSGGYYGSALQAAAYRGHEDVTQLLISSGADMYQSGLFRNTFCAAVTAGQDNIIELLIRNGYSGPVPPPPPAASRSVPDTIERRLLSEESLLMVFTPKTARSDVPVVPWGTGLWKGHDNPCASALLEAASSGNFSVVASIVRNWSELRVGTDTLIRSLEISCEHGHVEIASIILQTADIPGEKIRDSLDRAAWHGNENIVAILLDHKEIYGSPSSANFKLYSPKQGLPESLDGLPIKKYWVDYLHPTTKPSHLNETYANGHIVRILVQGCRGDQPSSVALALRLAPDFGLKNMLEASFLEAAVFDSIQVLNHLMKLYEQYLLPLVPLGYNMAIIHGALSSVAFMMKHFQGAVPRTVQLPSFIEKVIESGDAEALRQFLSQGPHSYEPLEWGLVQAAEKGHVHVLQVLYGHKDKILSFDFNAAKALHEAAAHGHFAAVEFLVRSGVNLNTLVKSYVSPDDAIGPFDQLRGPRWMITSDWKDRIPRSCLQACFDPIFRCRTQAFDISDDHFLRVKSETSKILSRQEEVLKLLMRHGAPISTTDKLGRNILHWAALTCTEISVREVLRHGHSVYTNDNNGLSPLAYAAARELDSLRVFDALLEFQDANETAAPALDYTQLLSVALKNLKTKPHGSFYESESIYDVLRTGTGAIVKKLLHLEPGMKAVGDGFGLLLQMVVICEDTDYLDLLIDREVDVNIEGYYYGSALEAAARFGRLDCIRKLLKAGADVNQGREHDSQTEWGDKRCCSPLHAAVLSGHLKTVRLLLDAGVDMQLRNYSCVLEAACTSGSAAMVQLLLFEPSAFGNQGTMKQPQDTMFGKPDDFLTIACRAGSESIVGLLLSHGYNPWNAILHHLRKRIRYHQFGDYFMGKRPSSLAQEGTIIKQLLDAVKNITEKDFSATLFDGCMILDEQAMIIGNFIIRELVGTHQFFPFCTNNLVFVRAWVEDEAFVLRVSALPKTPDLLFQVSIVGAQNCIDMVLDAGVDVHSKSREGEIMSLEGEQAIHIAAIFGKYRAVEQLLCRGANAHSVSPKFGSLPSAALQSVFKGDALFVATKPWYMYGHKSSSRPDDEEIQAACSLIIRLIQDNEMDIKTTFQDSVPPLYCASYIGSVTLVALCLDQGMDVNQIIESRGPPLAAAIKGDRSQIIEYLLSRGAQTNTSWVHYESIIHYACQFLQKSWGGYKSVYPWITPSEKPVSELIDWEELDKDRRSETGLLGQIEMLLRAGADVKLRSPSFGTYMHLACKIEAMSLVALLNRFGVDPNVTDFEQQSPLSALLTCGRDSNKTVVEKNLREFLRGAPEARVTINDVALAFEIGQQGFSLHKSSKNIVQILLDHDSTIVIDENLVDMIGKDTETLSMLLDKAPDLKLSSELIKASSKHYVSSFKLINQNQLRFYSPQELFDMLPSDDHYFGRGVVVLLQQDSTYCPPVTTISTLLEMRSPVALFAIELMLDRSPHLTVTASMLTKAVTADDDPRRWQENSRYWRENEPHLARHYQKTRLQLLLDHDKHCKIPQELIQLCQEPKHSDSMKTLKEHDPSI